MKKEDIPQDESPLKGISKELCYAVDENGKYSTNLSEGWDVKAKALDVAWTEINTRVAEAKQDVMDQKVSPVLYFMELKLMDKEIVAAYTGFWKWQINRHLKPGPFNRLSEKSLKKYAELFEIELEELKKPF